MNIISSVKAAGNALKEASGVDMSGVSQGGLKNFIGDIRNCNSREQEQTRIDKELANIRLKFANSNLTTYQRKKYVWKLVYIFMLGYEVDFGHMEIISLISSPTYSEKQVGYVAVSILMKSSDDKMTLVVNSVRNDLLSRNNYYQTLALSSVANIGGAEFASALTVDVQRTLTAKYTDSTVKKKAALCLLKLFRHNPESIVHEDWAPSMVKLLEDNNVHLGVILSIMALLIALATKSAADYEVCLPFVIHIFSRLVLTPRVVREDWLYYLTPSPWLQVKFLKFLQLYPPPTKPTQADRLNEILKRVLQNTAVSETVNKSNGDHSILFEAVNLILAYGNAAESSLRTEAMSLLGRFISVQEPNIRYLGLEALSRFALIGLVDESIKKHQNTVCVSLRDRDVSVRRQALDLLFSMCDHTNAESIVNELLTNLTTAMVTIREEMVLKIAILAERYATDLKWYVDTVLKLIDISGDHVSDDVWYRVIQIVMNHKDLQAYAAEAIFKVLESENVHETAVCVGGYILGEFGYLIAEEPGRGPDIQFHNMHKHFPNVKASTKALLLSTYIKFENLYPEMKERFHAVFDKYKTSLEMELQQRACEYANLPATGEDFMEAVLSEMPPYPEDKESALEARLKKKNKGEAEHNIWHKEDPEDDEDAEDMKDGKEITSNDEEDDFIGLEEGDTEKPQKSLNKNKEDQGDLLGGGLGEDFLGTGSPEENMNETIEVIGVPDDLKPRLDVAFKALLYQGQGVLFENDIIQIGIKHEYTGERGSISVFFGNKSGSAFTNFNSCLEDKPYHSLQVQNPPSTIASDDQQLQSINVIAMRPFDFSEAPNLTISFSIGVQPYRYILRFPLVPTNFTSPVTLPAQDYMAQWKRLDQSREKQEIINIPNSVIDSNFVSALKEKIITNFHFAIAPGLDQTEFTISGASTMRTGTKGPDGANLSVGCLVRVECNAEKRAIRVTCRAVHLSLANSVVNAIKSIIS